MDVTKFERQNRIYILPTAFGFVFLIGATLMILIGAAYQNNLVNMLAYFMLSLVFIGMIQTHNNLKDLKIFAVEPEGGFAETEFVVTTIVANDSGDSRFGIEASYKKLKLRTMYENVLPLTGKSTLRLKSSFVAEKRGRYPLKRVTLSTTYPIGLFRSWAWYETKETYCVYPKPFGTKALPFGFSNDETGSMTATAVGDDFFGHRKFEVGDSSRHIDWKARARGRGLLVKEFSSGALGSVELDWRLTEGLSTEDRLSQLAAWIEEAKQQKLHFSLSIPGKTIPLAQGRQHIDRCLEVLADYSEDENGKRKFGK